MQVSKASCCGLQNLKKGKLIESEKEIESDHIEWRRNKIK